MFLTINVKIKLKNCHKFFYQNFIFKENIRTFEGKCSFGDNLTQEFDKIIYISL